MVSKLNIGDIVEITGRTFKGFIGKISGVYEYSKNKFVYLVSIDNDREITVYYWNLKKIGKYHNGKI